MKFLNKNGINKVINHLVERHGVKNLSVGSDQNGSYVAGTVSDASKVISLLEGTNVKTTIIGGKLRLMSEEIAPQPAKLPKTAISTVADDNIESAAEEEAKNNGFDMNNDGMINALAKKLLPELLKTFPTKEEVNKALNVIKQGSVQDDQLLGGLERLEKNVKH